MTHPHRAADQPTTENLEPLAEVVELAGSLPGGFMLHHPLRAEIWLEQGEYVADVPELNVHAFGATRATALDNLRAAIVEQRSRLVASRPRFSRLMEEEAARFGLETKYGSFSAHGQHHTARDQAPGSVQGL